MKKIITCIAIQLLLTAVVKGQFFQGSFVKDGSNSNRLQISFKMKPTAAMTTSLAYLEAAFRFPTATTPAFTIDAITSNIATFPGLDIQRFTPDFNADGYTYYKFVFNTTVIDPMSFTAGTEYSLFSITTSLPASATPNFEMISNLLVGEYQFGAVNGAGNLLNPGTGDLLYGQGFYRSGDDHILPLYTGILPVTFRDFTVTKKEQDAVLAWAVENQDARTSHFDIERSADGRAFKTIYTVAADRSQSAVTYTFTDRRVTDLGIPTIYYRIKQTDLDGQFVYSPVRSLKVDGNGYGSVLYPNPGHNQVRLSFYLPAARPVSLRLVDAGGKAVQHYQLAGVQGINQQTMDVSSLSMGTYMLLITAGELTETIRFIKDR